MDLAESTVRGQDQHWELLTTEAAFAVAVGAKVKGFQGFPAFPAVCVYTTVMTYMCVCVYFCLQYLLLTIQYYTIQRLYSMYIIVLTYNAVLCIHMLLYTHVKWLGKYSTTGKTRRQVHELVVHTALSIGQWFSALTLLYIYYYI